MNRTLLLVGIGGFLGSISRYGLALWMTRFFPSSFPSGTFTVNIFGCFLIGLFYGLSERYDWFTPELRIFLATGFCGGFTTFSSFAYENISLLRLSQYFTFAFYTISSVALGLVGVIAGIFITKI
ncbi:MAG: fluoride efflux transporter CrcB [Chitinophagaceae bacterium]|nr:fluoride efflux transporter CrcB [Chitinophagaceae bacterium]